jgi:peptide/nickel transport system substrate-binding protein
MKILRILLPILLVCVLVINGCSSDKSTTSSTTTQTTAPGVTTTNSTPKTTVTASTTNSPTTSKTSAATTSATSSGKAPISGGTLKYLLTTPPSADFGWPLDSDFLALFMTNFIYAEPLFLYTVDGKTEPMLAESWKLSADNSAITFNLRKGVKFHDGSDFNAESVKFMLDSNIEAKTTASMNWKSIEVIDPYTIKLNLVKFQNSIWGDLGGHGCFIVSNTNVKKNGLDYARQHPVGTGPFKFVSWEKAVGATFVKNPDYWIPGKPYLDKIEFIFVKDSMTAQMALRNGEGQVIAMQSGKDVQDMAKLGFQTKIVAAGTDVLEPDSANEGSIFANKNIRLAIDYAIDRKGMSDAMGYGNMTPNNQLPPPANMAYDTTIPMREFSIAKSKELLAQAGYPNGFSTKIYTQAMVQNQALVAQEYLKAVGINADIQMFDNLAYWGQMSQGWKDGLWVSPVSFGPNFANVYKSIFPPTGVMHKSVKQPEGLADVITQAISTPDVNTQIELNKKITRMVYDDVMVVCMESNGMGFLLDPKVKDGDWLKGADFQYFDPASVWLSK